MMLWLLGMLFFRAANVSEAFGYLSQIFVADFLPSSMSFFLKYKFLFFFIFVLMIIEWFNRKREFGLEISHWKIRPLRWGVYYSLVLFVAICRRATRLYLFSILTMEGKLLETINQVRINSGLSKVESITPDMNLKNDLELDSISIAELIASIDVVFDTDINSEGMVETVGDIQNRLSL